MAVKLNFHLTYPLKILFFSDDCLFFEALVCRACIAMQGNDTNLVNVCITTPPYDKLRDFEILFRTTVKMFFGSVIMKTS